jgi:hypothetical protein
MSNRQYATPLVIRGRGRDEKVATLLRVGRDEPGFDEAWFQEKLFRHPELLPATEIEPAFGGLKAVARELSIGTGSADLLFVNPDGCIAVIETKLFRNPEAKREVVAQAIHYASELSGWSYERLVEAIRKAANSTEKDPLLQIVRAPLQDTRFDESRFKEQVKRNLQLGRILLLIVGDEIREEVERMAEFFSLTPHLHFTLGLIEMALFREGQDGTDWILVQPRVVARTQVGRRIIVEIRLPEGASMKTQVAPGDIREPEEQYYKELGDASPVAVELVKWVIAEAPDHQLAVDWRKNGPILKYRHGDGTDFNIGQLDRWGHFCPDQWLPRFRRLGLPEDIATDYLDDIIRLVPGSYRRERKFDNELKTEVILYPKGSKNYLLLAKLAPHKEKWFEAIDKAITRLQRALKARGQDAA